jgi:hypothetical protein
MIEVLAVIGFDRFRHQTSQCLYAKRHQHPEQRAPKQVARGNGIFYVTFDFFDLNYFLWLFDNPACNSWFERYSSHNNGKSAWQKCIEDAGKASNKCRKGGLSHLNKMFSGKFAADDSGQGGSFQAQQIGDLLGGANDKQGASWKITCEFCSMIGNGVESALPTSPQRRREHRGNVEENRKPPRCLCVLCVSAVKRNLLAVLFPSHSSKDDGDV